MKRLIALAQAVQAMILAKSSVSAVSNTDILVIDSNIPDKELKEN